MTQVYCALIVVSLLAAAGSLFFICPELKLDRTGPVRDGGKLATLRLLPGLQVDDLEAAWIRGSAHLENYSVEPDYVEGHWVVRACFRLSEE